MFQKTRILAGCLFLGAAVFTATAFDAAGQPPDKGDKGKFGPGMGKGMRPPIGVLLPPFVVDELAFTDAQKKQLDELQKDVDAKLAKILTADQKKQLDEMKARGPGGPGGGPGGGKGGKDKKGPPPPAE